MGAYGANYGANYAGVAVTEIIPVAPATKTVTAILCVNTSSKSNLCVTDGIKEDLCV